MKYSLNEKFRLVSEAKAIKKFKDDDLDVVAMVGVGMLFGENDQAPKMDNPKVESVDLQPQEQDLSLVLLDETAAPETNVPAAVQPQSTAVQNRAVAIDDNAYYIQVAVVTTQHGMEEYIAKLKREGVPVAVKPVTIKHKEGHRVLAGPYLSRSEAKADLGDVKKVEKDAYIRQL
ncbi:Sporulation related domain protein [compost metagenome]